MAAPLVLACDVADYNATTYECAAPYFTEQTTVLPALSIEDAQLIGAAVAYLLAIAFVFRLLRKFLQQS
ncbi:hypothetical protein ACTJIL_04840 [Luteimonas sp. 22616]|uniref:hypothetical protein n=1 Tax=Luteimonas sp. 22616 TaxID=3453951 RepID=UPI003F86DE90